MYLIAQIAYHISRGIPLWDYPARKAAVLYLALEDDYRRLQERLYRMFGTDGADKIRNSKQEKPFHELILQIGDKENMGAGSENGNLARQVLDEYYQQFQKRNPNLYVFSAHLHMDEATPHLHIDFVPFTTGGKRGLDTRVSLKQALAKQGFKGGSRGDTEWSQWVQSEKEKPIGIWGQRHLQYLKEYKQFVYLNLLTSGRLNEYLASVDEQAEDMFSRLVKEYADRQGVTEQLKAENQLEWVGKMNNIRSRAVEIIDVELICV